MTNRRSIRTDIRIWILSLAFVSVALSGLFLAKNVNDEVDRHVRLAQSLIQLYSDDTISIEFGRKNLVYVDDGLKRLNRLLNGERTRILSNDGIIVLSTAPSEIGQHSQPLDRELNTITATVREHSSREPLGTLEVVINRNALVSGAFEKAVLPAMLLLTSLLLLSFFAIRTLQKRLVHPINQLVNPASPSPTEPARWPTEIQDLSNRLQEALNQRDLAMVGQFSSGIIHDLKTSLHSLRTGVELTQASEPDSPRRKQCLELLLKSAAHHVPAMEALVSTTLDGTRSISINATPSDLKATLKSSIDKHSEMLRRYNVTLDVDVNFPDPVSHDSLQLERVFSNVLKNAIEAASEGTASSKQVFVRSRCRSDTISIIIDDSGPGLKTSPTDLLKSVKSSKVHGSGLGLWVSRKIIEAHRGTIRPGKSDALDGARFEITLPASQEVTL